MKLQIGDHVEVSKTPPGQEIGGGGLFIFEYQSGGVIVSADERGYMIKLHCAWGEWGPVPAERVQLDPAWAAAMAKR